jgi:hypothetical protein
MQQAAVTGIETQEGFIATCQCGSVRFEIRKQTKTAVALRCRDCGADASFKGSVAAVRLPSAEIAYALEHTVVRPDPMAGAPPPDDDGAPMDAATVDAVRAEKPRRFGFMVFPDQEPIINRALDVARIQRLSETGMRGQVWQGAALEGICADFLAGADPRALTVFDAMEAAVATEEAKLAAAGKDLPAKRLRHVRATARDAAAVAAGLLPDPAYVPPAPSPGEAETAAALDALQTSPPDDDRIEEPQPLHRMLQDWVRDEGATQCPGIMAGEVSMLPTWRKLAAEQGGFALLVQGDQFTRSAHGLVPRAALFLPQDSAYESTLQSFCAYYQAAFGERYKSAWPNFSLEDQNATK